MSLKLGGNQVTTRQLRAVMFYGYARTMDRAAVRARRLKLRMSVRGVARAVGISHAALSRFENGDLALSTETLDRLASLLGLHSRASAQRRISRCAEELVQIAIAAS